MDVGDEVDAVEKVEEVWVEGRVQASQPVERKGVSYSCKLLLYFIS